MKTWDIIRKHYLKGTQEGTLGRNAALNDACDLFLELNGAGNLKNASADLIQFNEDKELTTAILMRKDIEGMRKAGILR